MPFSVSRTSPRPCLWGSSSNPPVPPSPLRRCWPMRPFPDPLIALAPSQEDLLLLPARSHTSPQSCHLSDKVLADWGEMARRGLETASVMDGFLGGLIEAVRDPDTSLEGFHLWPEMDPAQICSFARSVAQGLRFLSSSMARLHTNCVLAMERCSPAFLPQCRFSRGQHVRPYLKNQAELRRDIALPSLPSRRPPKCPAPATATSTSFGGRPSGGARPHPPRSPRKFKVASKPWGPKSSPSKRPHPQ